MLPPMWSTLSRARRRLGGDGVAPPAEIVATTLPSSLAAAAELAAAADFVDAAPTTVPLAEVVEPAVPEPAPQPVEDIVIIFGRVEIDRLRHALQRALGPAVEPPNTPARIEHALGLILDLAGSPGRARVLRRPAGVSTPESWEIHLDGTERASGIAVREAGRTGRFTA
jgi:hypothetical protein